MFNNLKTQLLEEKKATFAKYAAIGMEKYYGLFDNQPKDARQEKLHAAYQSEIKAIETRYKIAAGQE